jgi:hypothetical protein
MFNSSGYLSDLKTELQLEWPKNRTINIVFHGHGVPAGYFNTPQVNTMSAYPNLFITKLKSIYQHAVINVVVSAIGGENSVKGSERFDGDVLIHKPDLILVDYSLNGHRVGLDKVYEPWNLMIKQAKDRIIPAIMLTPSLNQSVDYNSPKNELKKNVLTKSYNSKRKIRLDWLPATKLSNFYMLTKRNVPDLCRSLIITTNWGMN